MRTSDWNECSKCHKRTRLILGRDSNNHYIIGPCRPCMIADREAGGGIGQAAAFSGLCDECGTKTKLIEVDGVMTCPRCQTQYRNAPLIKGTERSTEGE